LLPAADAHAYCNECVLSVFFYVVSGVWGGGGGGGGRINFQEELRSPGPELATALIKGLPNLLIFNLSFQLMCHYLFTGMES